MPRVAVMSRMCAEMGEPMALQRGKEREEGEDAGAG